MVDKNTTPASAEPPAEATPTAAAPVPAAPASSTAGAPARKSSWAKYLTPALALLAALIVGGVAGVLIGQSTANASTGSSVRGGFGGEGAGGGTGTGRFGGAAGGARGGFTAGTITSVDGSTLTVKLADGSSVKVTTDGNTTVTQSSTISVDKLVTGETVTVIGPKSASGDITATRIAEGALGVGGVGGFRPGGAPTGAPNN